MIMAGRHLPADHSLGDANTIAGYTRVHGRPAAFEGRDGMSYSVALEVEPTGDTVQPFGAYFIFLRWRRIGSQGIEGHLETPFLAYSDTREKAAAELGSWLLNDVARALDVLLAEASNTPRRWFDVMRDEEEG